jgi:integrase
MSKSRHKSPFEALAQQYIKNLALEDGRNIPIKTRQLRQEIIPYFQDYALDDIKRIDVEAFKRHLREKGLSAATVNRYLAVLSHLFHKAVEWEWVAKLPCKIVRYREEHTRLFYLSKEDIQQLLLAAKQDDCPIIEPFIRIALGTAMRRMEILSLEIDNIHCREREIYIPKAKTGARTQPMTRHLAEYLANYIHEMTHPGQQYLFPSPKSRRGFRQEIEKLFRRVIQAAGLDPKLVCRHTLRHTAITHLVQAGVDLPTVQRFSGHRSLHMVFRYSHQSKEHINWALSQLEDRLNIENNAKNTP